MAAKLLPPKQMPPNTPAPPPTAGAPVIQAWYAEVMQDRAFNLDIQNADYYKTYTFTNWLVRYQLGGGFVPNTPPQPPTGLMVDVSNPDNPLLVYMGPPVCEIPPYEAIPQPPIPGTVAIGSHDTGFYWNKLVNDDAAGGYVTPTLTVSQDGMNGIWERIAYPWGGWYLLQYTSAETPYPGVPVWPGAK
jgi:hypothetical protein